jgi:hypothetical protein
LFFNNLIIWQMKSGVPQIWLFFALFHRFAAVHPFSYLGGHNVDTKKSSGNNSKSSRR